MCVFYFFEMKRKNEWNDGGNENISTKLDNFTIKYLLCPLKLYMPKLGIQGGFGSFFLCRDHLKLIKLDRKIFPKVN